MKTIEKLEIKVNFQIQFKYIKNHNDILFFKTENNIGLSCHLRRGSVSESSSEILSYELVSFSGYYRVQGNPDSMQLLDFVINTCINCTFYIVSSTSRVSSSWGDDSKESTNFGDALTQYNG